MNVLALGLFACLAPQDLEFSGKVSDRTGKPVVGAAVELAALPLSPPGLAGTRSHYKLAMASQRKGVALPKTVTDGDGEWRMLLSPQHAALAAAEAVEMELVVRAPGMATWRRALGPQWSAATGTRAVLAEAGPGLHCQLVGGEGAYLGFALVERPFRVPGGRSVWLQDLVPLPGNGLLTFREPPRVPGEADAPSATARLEAYRVTIYGADLEARTAFVDAGPTTLMVTKAPGARRRILKERAELVPGAITATWMLAGQALELEFATARVPLLGGEAPVAIRTTLGPAALDAWDPDQPLFLAEAVETTNAADSSPAGGGEGPFEEVTIQVRRKDQGVFGAGVWIEDSASKRAGPGAVLAAMTDPEGRAKLQGLPPGTWRVLVRHALHGQRETLVTVPAREAVTVTLARREEGEERTPQETLPGSLLIDLGPPREAGRPALEVGVLGPDNRLVRRTFDEPSRLLRLDGLVPGPTNLYLRFLGEPPILLGGVLAQGVEEAPVRIEGLPLRKVRFLVRDSKGELVTGAKASLGEVTPAGKVPLSAGLVLLEPASSPGAYGTELRALGALTLRVHGPDDERLDLPFPNASGFHDLRLEPAPPAPEGPASRRGR